MKRRLLAIVLAGVLVFSQNGAVLAAENSAADGTAAEVTVEEPDQAQEEIEEQDAEPEDPAPEEEEEISVQPQENTEDPAPETEENTEDPAPETEEGNEEVSADAEQENAAGTEVVETEPEAAAEEAAEEEIVIEGEVPAQETVSDAAYGLYDHTLFIIPEEIDPSMTVGDDIVVEPEVGWFQDGGFFEVENVQIEYLWEYDDECVRITDNGDGTYTVTRISDLGTDFTLKARIWADGEEQWAEPRNYYFENYGFEIFVDGVEADCLFEDSTGDYLWYCYVTAYYNQDDPFEFTVEAEGSNGEDADEACWINKDEGLLFIDGAQLKQLGIGRVKVRVGGEINGYPLSDTREIELDVRDAYVEDQFDFYDRSLLPGWDQWVSTLQNVYVEDARHAYGDHLLREVTNVEVEDEEGQDVVIIESQEYDGWRLRAQNMGVSKVTVTYTDWDETEGKTEVFYLYVGGEVYDVDVWSDSGSKMVLKGGTVPMSAQASLETYDPANDYYHSASEEELADITYDWSLWIHQDNAREELGDVITVTPDAADPRKAVVSFEGVPEEWDEGIDVNVTVTISDEGEEVAENNYWLRMDNQYLELWPTRIDGDLGVGESFTLAPELREYPGENGAEYDILPRDQVSFEPEIYDYDAYEVEDNGDGTFKVTRRRNYDCSFRIVAYYEYDRVADREYWFNRKDYNFHYDIDGSDKIYSDGSRTFGFDLSELGGIEFELVPEVGQGYYDEYGGFDYNIPEGYGWSYNSTTHEITFDGEALYDRGCEFIDTRISLRIGGEEVSNEWRHFDIREPRFDIWDEIDERPLFIGEDRIISKQGGAFIENNAFPDGGETTYTITELTFNPDESEEDPRDPITVTDEGDHWRLEAVRNGMVEVHAVYEVGGSRGAEPITLERDYTLFVGGWRYDFNLRTSTGSDKLLTGGEITLFPEIYGEGYDWQTGERYNIDTSDYEVIYYVECTHVDDDLLEREYDWDFDAASARGELWDYTENPQDRSITITAENFDGAIDIWVSAELYDPETGDSYAHADRTIYVDPMTFALKLYEEDEEAELEWNEQLPPGGEITFVPGIVRTKTGTEPTPIGNPDDVVYTMEWHAGGGEWDPGHFYVEKANGEEVHPGEQVTAQDAPFTIKKLVPWDANLFIRADWKDEEENRQEAWRDFKIYEQEYSKGFIANNDRGDDHFTWYYNDEEVSVRPDREKLDELLSQGYNVETNVEIGIWDREHAEMTPIPQYDPAAAGVFDEQNGLHARGEALEDLRDHLAAAFDERDVPRVFLRIHSELGGVTICDEIFQVALMEPYAEIMGLGDVIPLGEAIFLDEGEVQLYVEDSLNDTGVNGYYETGLFYDIEITDISIGAEDQQYLTSTPDGTGWTIQARQLADHAIPVTVTFTGGPEGYSPLTVEIEIIDTAFWAELMTSSGESAEHIKILMNETEQLKAEVTRVSFEADDLPTESVLPDEEGYHYEIRYEFYNRDVVDIDENTGIITPLKTGTTDYSFLIAIYDKDGNEVDGQWRDGVIEVSAFFVEIEVPEGAVFEVVPGKDYTAQEIFEGLGAQFKLYSMRHPEGVMLTAHEFFIDKILDETEGVSLKDESWGGYGKLSIDKSAQPGSFGIVLQVEDDSYSYRTSKPVNIEIIDPHSGGSWQHDNTGYWYLWPDGTYPRNGFETIDGDTYYFNNSGYRVTSWQQIGGKWYYFDSDGIMQTGWQDISKVRYYFNEDGVMLTGWKEIDGDWYYFNSGGAMQKNWQQLGGKWYYFDGEGRMLTYWQDLSGARFYFDENGAMLTGWQEIDGDWYYFNSGGAMQRNWQQLGGKWYYFDGEGRMLTGWQDLSGARFYFNDNGAMQTGWKEIDGDWYFFNSSGAMVRGWQQAGSWYYFDSDGKMITGLQQISGKYYFFDASGAMKTGWRQIDDDWYYFNAGGDAKTGWLQSGKAWYYFDSDGKMLTGLQEIGQDKYYFDASGAMKTGWQQDGDDWYYFEASGAAARSKWVGDYYMTESGVMATNTLIDGKYYVGPDGKWIPNYTESTAVN